MIDMKMNLSTLYLTDKPSDIFIKKINSQIAHGQRDLVLPVLRKCVLSGASFSPAYLNTPILDDDMQPLVVTKEQYDAHKSKERINPLITTHKVAPYEIGKPIIRRKAICWSEQSLFALDFDNDPSTGLLASEEAIKRAKKYGLGVCWVYHTFSSSNKREKYRMLFQTAEPITDYRAAYAIQQALMVLFPECDKSCDDLSRLFFGTNKKKDRFKADNYLDVKQLFKSLHSFYQLQDSHNYSRNIEMFCKNNGLSICNNIPVVTSNQKMIDFLSKTDEYLYRWNSLTFCFDVTEFEAKYKGYRIIQTLDGFGRKVPKLKSKHTFEVHRDFDFEKLEGKCKLAKTFVEGQEHIDHPDLIRLMTNLIHVYGGQDYFLDNLQKSLHLYGTPDKYNKLAIELGYCVAQEYSPYGCDTGTNVCPYISECSHGKNMLEQVILKRKDIVDLSEKDDGKTIDDAYNELKKIMTDIYNGTPEIHLVKAPTGIGKTEIYIGLAQPGDVIVTPTHALDQEIAQRLQDAGKECIIAAERPPLAEEGERAYFNQLLKLGGLSAANAFYNKKVEEYLSTPLKNCKQLNCINFVRQQAEIKKTDKIIVATHAKLPAIGGTLTVFVDEDIMDTSLISQGSASLEELDKLVDHLNWDASLGDEEIERLYKIVRQYVVEIKRKIKQKAHVIYTGLPLSRKQRQMISDTIKANLFDFKTQIYSFFDAGYYNDVEDEDRLDIDNFDNSDSYPIKIVPVYTANGCKNVTIVKLNKSIFRPGINYIVMSATASEALWRKAFPQVKVHEVTAKKTDRMYLYFKESMSRSNIKRNMDGGYLTYIKNVIRPDMPVITFKGLKKELKDAGFANVREDLHLGKTAGSDALKGQDVALIGTPHLNPHAYLCVAAALGIDVSMVSMSYRRVERNGYKFWFYVFESLDLREVQLHTIEAELIQAAGRARVHRTDAKVYIFSNYPIPGVKLAKSS